MNGDVLYTYTQTRRYTKENKKIIRYFFFFSYILEYFSIGLYLSTIFKYIFLKNH